MSETISVVIPVLNDARVLARCLASLAAQRRLPDEVVVVDNGSTDDSVAVAGRFSATVVTEPRRGITAASARGFDTARGTIIARCDADSVLPEDWLERIEQNLTELPDAVAITGPGDFYEMNGPLAHLTRFFYIYGYFASMWLLLGHNVLFGSNCAVRAATWHAVSASVPREDSEIHDDMDLSYRLPAASRVILDRRLRVGISPRPFVSFRVYARRWARAWHTFSLHLPQELPHRRWSRRLTRTQSPRLIPTADEVIV